jgi:shikimate kinase
MPNTNITLIGMPGSGKSYIGKKLAEKLDYKLLELDSLLETEYDLPLQKILDDLGDESFLEKQAEDAIKNTRGQNSLVISPGGSIVYTDYAMEHLKKVSTLIYLKTSLETIQKRIKENSRGIVGLKDKSLNNLYIERVQLYEKYAEITIDGEQDVGTIIDDIVAGIRNLTGTRFR